jgi:hypothetical protein
MSKWTKRLTAATAIAAAAGTTMGAKYVPFPDTTDSADNLTASEKTALAVQAASQAGFYSTTVQASVVYGNDNLTVEGEVSVPLLLWDGDALLNAASIERVTRGELDEIVGAISAFSTSGGVGNDDNLTSARSFIATFSGNPAATGSVANNVFHDESFPGDENGTANAQRTNSPASITPTGIAVWRANFNTSGATHNNIEGLDLIVGRNAPAGGSVIAPAQTTVGNPGSPTPAWASGRKLLTPGIAGVDGFAPNGSARLQAPSVIPGTAGFFHTTNGWDGIGGNTNGGDANNGHNVNFTGNNLAGTDITMPAHAWAVENAPDYPDGTIADLRQTNLKIENVNCGGSNVPHALFGWATSGFGSTDGDTRVLIVDSFTGGANGSGSGNGYLDGAYYIAASPAVANDWFVPTGVGDRYTLPGYRVGIDQNIRFAGAPVTATGGVGNAGQVYDISRNGDVVAIWFDRTDESGAASGNPYDDVRIQQVHLYEANLGQDCRVNTDDAYGDEIVIAENGAGIPSRGITYNNGLRFEIPQLVFCDDGTPGVSNNITFSGVGIDDDGNIAFTATTAVFNEEIIDDPQVPNEYPPFADCFETPAQGSPVSPLILLDGSTSSLMFYSRDNDTLFRVMDGGVNGLRIAADASAPEDVTLSVGRFTTDDDTDRFNSNGLSDTGTALAVTFRPGDFFLRDEDDDGRDEDVQGVLLDNMMPEDGGFLLDETQTDFVDQVVNPVRGVVLVDLGPIEDLEPMNQCQFDFDNDGDVDGADFGSFGAAFGSMTGDANYNAQADGDGSGTVDGADFGSFGAEFGRTDCLEG